MLITFLQHFKRTRLIFFLAVFLGGSGLTLYLSYRPYTTAAGSTQRPIAAPQPMDTPASTSPAFQDAATPTLQVSEIVASNDPLRKPSPARIPYRSTDDTLPSPPAAQEFDSSYVKEGAAYRWLDTTFSDDPTPPQWMLQETVAEESEDSANHDDEEEPFKVDSNSVSNGKEKTEVACIELSMDAGTAPEVDIGTAEARTLAAPAASVEQGRSSGSRSYMSPATAFDSSQQRTPSSMIRQSLPIAQEESSPRATSINVHQEKRASSSSDTTPVIDIPLPASARRVSREDLPTSQSAPRVAEDAADAASARPQRPAVLVSPAMVDDSPDTNSWMSPARADDADVQNHLLADKRDVEKAQKRCVSYTERQEDEQPAAAAIRASLSPSAASNNQADDLPSASRGRNNENGRDAATHLISPSPTRPTTSLSAAAVVPQQRQRASSPFAKQSCAPAVQHSPRSSIQEAAAETSPATKGALQRLRLQLNQAERAAALQQALRDAAQHENEDLQLQLDELLRIQSEFERRSQLQEASLAAAVQRHAAEKVTWEMERVKELEQMRATHDTQRCQWETVTHTLQVQLVTSHEEVHKLQVELASTRDELRALVEERESKEKALSEAKTARETAEQLYASLQSRMEDLVVRTEHTACEEGRVAEKLRVTRKETEERAAVAELAFHTLCDQLASALDQQNLTFGSCEVSALSISGQALRSDVGGSEASQSINRSAATPSTVDVRSALQAAMKEEDVAAAVEAALCRQGVAATLPSSSPQPSNAAENAEIAKTTAAASSSPDNDAECGYHLSDWCRASLQQHRQEVQKTLTSVADRYRRVAREARAAADAQAAAMERVLSAELRQLRVQVTEHPPVQVARAQRRDAGVDAKPTLQDHATDVTVVEQTSAARLAFTAAGAVADLASASVPQSSAADPPTAATALTETKHALLLERHHTALLRRELEELHEARYTATLLTNAEETLKDVHQSLSQLIHEAVVEIQKSGRTMDSCVFNNKEKEEEEGFGEGEHGRRVRESDTRRPQRGWPSATTAFPSPTAAGSAAAGRRIGQLDGTMMQSVHKAVLLAEAQVERVGDELLGEARRGHFADTVRILEPLHRPSTTWKSALSEDSMAAGNRTPTSTAASPRSGKQQRVYEELQGLLHRSYAEENGQTPPPAAAAPLLSSACRYSPDGSRWLTGIRPPPLRNPSSSPAISPQRSSSALPSGAVVTPARPTHHSGSANVVAAAGRGPSPYVLAYVRAVEEAPATTAAGSVRLTSPSVVHAERSTTGPAALSSSTALRLFEGMVATTRELRNVADLLELLRDNEEAREEKQQAYLRAWEDQIRAAVKEGVARVQATMASLRPPNTALEYFQRQRQDQRSPEDPLRTPLRRVDMDTAAMASRPQPSVRLADVLAGKPVSRSVSSTGAVCYPHSE